MAQKNFDDVAILLRDNDSVGVLKRPVKAGDEVIQGPLPLRITQNIGAGHKIALSYRDEQDRVSERTVWPFAVSYHETVRLLIAWCELRTDFRSFRTDRVTAAEFLEARYPERPAVLRARWRKLMNEKMAETRSREAAPDQPKVSPR